MVLLHATISMYLPFLRPLALPKASTFQRFLSTSSSSSTLSNPSTTSPPLSLSTRSTQNPAPSPFTSSSAAITKAASSPLPYRVNRTPTANLPVYLLAKRGGNLKQTKLRKIEGDISALRMQLRDALKLDDKDIVINQLTKHIIIRVSCDNIHKPGHIQSETYKQKEDSLTNLCLGMAETGSYEVSRRKAVLNRAHA